LLALIEKKRLPLLFSLPLVQLTCIGRTCRGCCRMMKVQLHLSEHKL
jgi:hypothetical protein